MKKRTMALAIFLATGVTMQAQDRLTQYKVRNAISVRTPIMNDSINPKGEKHTKKMLLQTPVVLHLPDAPMQSLTADTAGYLSFEKADKDNKLYLVKTQIRAERFLKGKILAIACPKLDHDTNSYVEKLQSMIDDAKIDTLTVLIMEVPCCGGLMQMALKAREQATRNIPIKRIVLSVEGEVKSEEWM